MSGTKKDLVLYRLQRARETFEDAQLLADGKRWNSAINRLYYAAYYAVTALLLENNHHTNTHNGVKAKFSEEFIKTGIFPIELGKMYAQLFTWRQKGDYSDLFDFTQEKVIPYFPPVLQLIQLTKQYLDKRD